jgi:hypothetical protein
VYRTADTFTRETYFGYLQDFVASGKCSAFPGKHSVFIVDGAKIHLDEFITAWIRSVGCEVVFLPAYCPFFMPIEYAFGFLKREFKQVYDRKGSELHTLMKVLQKMTNMNMRSIFSHCGYTPDGRFDAAKNFKQ